MLQNNFNFQLFMYVRPNSKTVTEKILMKSMKHTVEGCEVCAKQIRRATLKDESANEKDLSFPQDEILMKIVL